MIQSLHHKNLNRSAYDRCVAEASNASPYALSWYLDLVSQENWSCLVYGDYEAVFPYCHRRSLGLRLIYQPLFTQHLGLFSKMDAAAIPPVIEFIKAIPAEFKALKLNLHPGQSLDGSPSLERDNFMGRSALGEMPCMQNSLIEQGVTHHLKLDHSHEALQRNFSENTRRNIRKGCKANLQVKHSRAFETFGAVEFMEILMANQAPKIRGLTKADYLRIPVLMKACAEREAASFVRVELEGKMVAGLFFLEGFDWMIHLFGASSEEARKSGAVALAMDSFIEKNANSGKTLDFEGSMVPGIARFYRSFGSEVIHFDKISCHKLPFWYRKLRPS